MVGIAGKVWGSALRIMYVTTEFVTERKYGGLGTYLAKITQLFAEKDHEVIVLVLSHCNERMDYKPNIIVERVKLSFMIKLSLKLITLMGRIRSVYKPLLWNYQSYFLNRKAKTICKRVKIDLIQYASPAGTGLYRMDHLPSVVRISSYQPLWRASSHYEYNFEKALEKINWEDRLELMAASKADGIFGPSRLLAEIFQRKTGKVVEVIETPLPMNIGIIDDQFYQENFQGIKYLIFYGTLNPLKGLLTISEAIWDILDKYKDLHFILVGRASRTRLTKGMKMSDYVIRKAGVHAERVHYIPFLKKEQLFSLIKHADGCVLPSRIDNLPNSCIEAMSLGKIVIGTRGASFEQLIVDGENGFLCEVDSPEGLKDKIDCLMGLTEQERENMSEKAKERAGYMDPQLIYEKHLSFYESVIHRFWGDGSGEIQ